jgi:hypothetical protein
MNLNGMRLRGGLDSNCFRTESGPGCCGLNNGPLAPKRFLDYPSDYQLFKKTFAPQNLLSMSGSNLVRDTA